jgi:hypothetical protein
MQPSPMRKPIGKSKGSSSRLHFIPLLNTRRPRRGQTQLSGAHANFSRIGPDSKRITGVLQRVKICLLN